MSINFQTGTNLIHKHPQKINTVRIHKKNKEREEKKQRGHFRKMKILFEVNEI